MDGSGNVAFDFALKNTGNAPWVNVWLRPFALPPGASVVSLVPEAGRGAITQYPTSWYWAGVNLDVGASATVRITIRLEVE